MESFLLKITSFESRSTDHAPRRRRPGFEPAFAFDPTHAVEQSSPDLPLWRGVVARSTRSGIVRLAPCARTDDFCTRLAARDAEEGSCHTNHIGADGASHRWDMDVADDSVHGVTPEAEPHAHTHRRGAAAVEVNI